MSESFKRGSIRVVNDSVPNIAHAMNMGWMVARNELIGFVNDDIEFSANWVKNVKYWFNSLTDAKSIGGPAYDFNQRKMATMLTKDTFYARLYDKLVMGGDLFKTAIINDAGGYSIGNDEPKCPVRVSQFSGVNMVVLKNVLQELGGFMTIFKYSGPEGYFYLQMAKRRYPVYLVPGCSVIHYPNPSGGTRDPFYIAHDYAIYFRMIRPETTLGKIRKILNELSFFIYWSLIYKKDLRKFFRLIDGYLAGIRLYIRHPNGDVVA